MGEGVEEYVGAFLKVDDDDWKQSTLALVGDETMLAWTCRGHWWVDAEMIRSVSHNAFRGWILDLTGRTTIDRLMLQQEARWIILTGLEQLDDASLATIREALLSHRANTYGWLLMSATWGEPRLRELMRMCELWYPIHSGLGEKNIQYRLHRAGLLEAGAAWAAVLSRRESAVILEPFWLSALGRDATWATFLYPLLEQVWGLPKDIRGKILELAREIERQPMQREIFRWRWFRARIENILEPQAISST
jgi:hypothetical protein